MGPCALGPCRGSHLEAFFALVLLLVQLASDQLGRAKIDNLKLVVFFKHEVLGLDVSMAHGDAFVEEAESLEGLFQNVDEALVGESLMQNLVKHREGLQVASH